MPARKKISMRQAELLVEFAEAHHDIALNRFSGGPQASQVARRAWESLALQLNAVAEGTIKTPDQWRRYWIEYKAKTKNKAADCRRNAAATGGGPNKLVPLNELENRVMALIGPVAVEGLHGVRLPFSIPSTDDPASSLADPIPSTSSVPHTISNTPIPQSFAPSVFAPDPIMSPDPQMDVEWLEEIPSPLGITQQSELQEIENTQPVEPQMVERDAVQSPAAPLAVAPVEPQPGEVPATDRNPQQPVRPVRTSRSQRQIRRDERVPRWAYDLETRRIAAEERLATAMEAMVELMREIKNDVQNYIRS